LLEGECLGACGDAPVMLVNNSHVQLHDARSNRQAAGGAELMAIFVNGVIFDGVAMPLRRTAGS
jgi:hypothetical protein